MAPSSGFQRIRPRHLWPVLLIGACLLAVLAVVIVFATRPEGEPVDWQARGAQSTPGELLHSDPLDNLPDGVSGWRIIYGTTDGQGRHVAASGVVIVPTAASDQPRPVLSVGHATVGIQADCAPSERPAFPIQPSAVETQLALSGWALVQSDYIGLGIPGPDGVHPYLDGDSEAHAVLDATRAARHLRGSKLSNKTVLYGISQGGHAALWAGAEAPKYAPDLDVIGVVAAAPATDLAQIIRKSAHSAMGLLVDSYVAVSWAAVHPGLDMPSLVSDWQGAKEIAGSCVGPSYGLALRNAHDEPLFESRAYEGEMGRLLRENTPTERIDAPVLIAQGGSDTVVLPSVQRKYVEQRCAAGQHLQFRQYPDATHASLGNPGSPFIADAVAWIRARLAGSPPTPTC